MLFEIDGVDLVAVRAHTHTSTSMHITTRVY